MNKNKVLERDIEKYLVDKVGLIGKAYKFSSPGNRSVPDRLCLFSKGVAVFVECKAPGKTLTPLQRRTIKFMRLMDHEVLVIDSKKMVDIFIESTKEVLNEK